MKRSGGTMPSCRMAPAQQSPAPTTCSAIELRLEQLEFTPLDRMMQIRLEAELIDRHVAPPARHRCGTGYRRCAWPAALPIDHQADAIGASAQVRHRAGVDPGQPRLRPDAGCGCRLQRLAEALKS